MAKILIADDRQLMRSALKTVFAMRPQWGRRGRATHASRSRPKQPLTPDGG